MYRGFEGVSGGEEGVRRNGRAKKPEALRTVENISVSFDEGDVGNVSERGCELVSEMLSILNKGCIKYRKTHFNFT